MKRKFIEHTFYAKTWALLHEIDAICSTHYAGHEDEAAIAPIGSEKWQRRAAHVGGRPASPVVGEAGKLKMDSLRRGWIRGPVCLRPVPEAVPGRLSRNFTRKMALRAMQTKGADTILERRMLTLRRCSGRASWLWRYRMIENDTRVDELAAELLGVTQRAIKAGAEVPDAMKALGLSMAHLLALAIVSGEVTLEQAMKLVDITALGIKLALADEGFMLDHLPQPEGAA